MDIFTVGRRIVDILDGMSVGDTDGVLRIGENLSLGPTNILSDAASDYEVAVLLGSATTNGYVGNRGNLKSVSYAVVVSSSDTENAEHVYRAADEIISRLLRDRFIDVAVGSDEVLSSLRGVAVFVTATKLVR